MRSEPRRTSLRCSGDAGAESRLERERDGSTFESVVVSHEPGRCPLLLLAGRVADEVELADVGLRRVVVVDGYSCQQHPDEGDAVLDAVRLGDDNAAAEGRLGDVRDERRFMGCELLVVKLVKVGAEGGGHLKVP